MQHKVFLEINGIEVDLPNGVTIGIGKIEPVQKGWVSKLRFAQNLEGQKGMQIALAIANETTHFVSGFKDGEVELWDVVMIFDNEAEAAEVAKKEGQMTIYNIETGTLKWLN